LTSEQRDRTNQNAVLVVCGGNTCRSPLGAAMLRRFLADEGLPHIDVCSAGVAAPTGSYASQQARQVARELGLDLAGHLSQNVESIDWGRVPLVLTMTRAQAQTVRDVLDRAWRHRQAAPPMVMTLVEAARLGVEEEGDVQDPFGGSIQEYRRTADRIALLLQCAMPAIVNALTREDPSVGFENGAQDVRGGAGMTDTVFHNVAVGCDHGGYPLKVHVLSQLEEMGLPYIDVGTDSDESVDYPDFAARVAHLVATGRAGAGVLMCGSGIGMAIAANKVRGVRAAVCHDPYSARATRKDNDANILTMGARVTGPGLAREVVQVFLTTAFEAGGRHERRVNKITQLEDAGLLEEERR